jgi:hypothetical protein
MSPAKITYPGVYVEETRTSIKVIPGVSTRNKAAIKVSPSKLMAAGYKIVQSQIEPGGLSLLLAKGAEHRLVRMSDYRDGTNPVNGKLVVTFVATVP